MPSRKAKYQKILERKLGKKGATMDRMRTAKKVHSLNSKTAKAIKNRASWSNNPAGSDIAGIDTRVGIKDDPEFGRTRKDYVTQFNARPLSARTKDRMKTSKTRTRLKKRTPHALKVRKQWSKNPGSADIMGIDNKMYKPKKRSGRVKV